jgi:1-acyl-sn-glycerol-3-phosphate acyltransferase
MKAIFYILAGIRALLVFGFMVIFIGSYTLSTFVIPHTKERALNLRRNFIRFVVIPIFNVHIQLEGYPTVKPALYICNHRSFIDPLAICKYLDAFVIAKAEVANYPIINKGAELSGVVWVDRNNKDSRAATRDKMIEVLQSGYNILVFPEGTVGKDPYPLPFRKGTFIEAAEHQINVVPIAMEFQSAQDLWVLEKFIPQYFYQFSKWRTNIKLKFGEPLTGTNGEELCNQAYDWVSDEVSKMQEGWSDWAKK